MAVYRSVYIKETESQRLYDLASISFDLTTCIDLCERVKTMPPAREELHAFAIAIPTLYCRVFVNGARDRVDKAEMVERFDETQRAFHQKVLRYRSLHVAHSVGDMEEQYLHVALNPAEMGRRINNVNATHHTLGSLAASDYDKIASLCRSLLAWIEQETRLEGLRLKEILTAKYTLDELYAMNLVPPRSKSLMTMSDGGRPRLGQPTAKKRSSD